MARLRLTVELVPRTAWGKSLYRMLSACQWCRLRSVVLADADKRCEICGADGRLWCHEVWTYDDKKHVQRLRGVQALCALCHAAKHRGAVARRIMSLPGGPEALKRHVLRVNDCDAPTWKRHMAASWRTWQKRSRSTWRTDFGPYADLAEGRS